MPWHRGQTPLALLPRYEDMTFEPFFENIDYNDYWRQPGFATDEYFDNYPNIPALWVVGWHDQWIFRQSMIESYQRVARIKSQPQYLIVGPWIHNNFSATCGDVNFGTEGATLRSYNDFMHLELKWFNRWLKSDTTVDIGPRVQLFVMGGGDGKKGSNGKLNHGGRWHSFDSFPPKGVQPTAFYLHRDWGLSTESPAAAQSSTTYTFDPRNPVSSTSGRFAIGPHDQIERPTLPGFGTPGMPIASRPDVLVFQTPPLQQDLTIVGNVEAELYISSDAPDTDFFIKLIDFHPPSADYPTGYALPVAEGIVRARYRESYEKPTLLKPGKIYKVKISIEPTANLFKVRHRIRVDITSSNFPNFDINRNTGDPHSGTWRIANNTVYHEAIHASRIMLPVWTEEH